MKVNLESGATYSSASPRSAVKTLEGQVVTITKQIDVVAKDPKIDCTTKDSRLGTLHAQLDRTEDQLRGARADARGAASGKGLDRQELARAAAARERGGVDSYA